MAPAVEKIKSTDEIVYPSLEIKLKLPPKLST
jgi:hypothetical protein